MFADLLRERETRAPQWVAEVINIYYWAKQGVLPDNRGLNYNNPHLLELLNALSDEEAKWMRETMPEPHSRVKISDERDIEALKRKAIEAARKLSNQVVQRLLDGT